MTRSTFSASPATNVDPSPETDRRSFGWLAVALVPVVILASTVTTLASMG